MNRFRFRFCFQKRKRKGIKTRKKKEERNGCFDSNQQPFFFFLSFLSPSTKKKNK